MELPEKKYEIIYADPPWHYRDSASAGKRGAVYKYPCMKTKDIAALPVQEIASENCVLFLWSTMPQLEAALSVIEG